jgi:hypothetical protein
MIERVRMESRPRVEFSDEIYTRELTRGRVCFIVSVENRVPDSLLGVQVEEAPGILRVGEYAGFGSSEDAVTVASNKVVNPVAQESG